MTAKQLRAARPAVLTATALALLAGCTTSHRAERSVASPIPMPPADARGPIVEAEADVAWTDPHPGCMTMSTAVAGAGIRLFRLTGPAAQALREESDRGQRAAGQRLRVRGYVDSAQDTAICGPYRAFVLTEVVATL